MFLFKNEWINGVNWLNIPFIRKIGICKLTSLAQITHELMISYCRSFVLVKSLQIVKISVSFFFIYSTLCWCCFERNRWERKAAFKSWGVGINLHLFMARAISHATLKRDLICKYRSLQTRTDAQQFILKISFAYLGLFVPKNELINE